MGISEQVAELVAPRIATHGLHLYDVEHTGGTLRVTVQHPEGVDLGTLSDLTRELSRLLDEHDPLPGRYTLEVSSPGLERRLRTPAHLAAAVGEEVVIRLTDEVEGDRRLSGVLEGADDDGVTVDGRTVPHHHIERARTVFRWGPAPKPSAGRAKKQTRKTKGASRS